ncbi:MAG: DUF1127 domain-containing protein [Hyphomicrobiaceae bacterium]|nr:DUF1127 domain-containing protein [Hyphomicrobiaceae bacterium]
MARQLSTLLSGRTTQSRIGYKILSRTQHAWSRYWTQRAACATVAILNALDDRTLKDIGLDRSEIGPVVHGRAGCERRLCWAAARERALPW